MSSPTTSTEMSNIHETHVDIPLETENNDSLSSTNMKVCFIYSKYFEIISSTLAGLGCAAFGLAFTGMSSWPGAPKGQLLAISMTAIGVGLGFIGYAMYKLSK